MYMWVSGAQLAQMIEKDEVKKVFAFAPAFSIPVEIPTEWVLRHINSGLFDDKLGNIQVFTDTGNAYISRKVIL